MTESCITLLSRLYNHEKVSSHPLIVELDTLDLYQDAEYLTQNGYITQPSSFAGALSLALTEKGRQYVENGYSTPSPSAVSNHFNFAGANFTNSVVGSDIHDVNYSFNAGVPFEELKELIVSKPAADQEQLKELLSVLQGIDQSDQPVNKGILIRFSDLLQKYSDLIVPVGKILLGIFSGGLQ